MSRVSSDSASKASLHRAVATGVRVLSFRAVSRALSAAPASVVSFCKTPSGMPQFCRFAVMTVIHSLAIARIPSRLAGSQSDL
jgi:hypothetical protein